MVCCVLVGLGSSQSEFESSANDSNVTNCNFTDTPCSELPVSCMECESDSNSTNFSCTYGRMTNTTCTVVPESVCQVSLCILSSRMLSEYVKYMIIH